MQGLIGSCKNTTKIYNFPLIFSLCYDIIFNCQSNFGWVPEWPKGADCKSVATRFGGSNPVVRLRRPGWRNWQTHRT